MRNILATWAMLSFTLPAFAAELVLLPIKEIRKQRSPGVQAVVTFDFQACKHNYRGLYFEDVTTDPSAPKIEVRALASERMSGVCAGPFEPRTDSATFSDVDAERIEFIPIQPKP